MRPSRSLSDLLEQLGAPSWREIADLRERWQLQKQWRATFAPDHTDWSGPLVDTDWLAFSCGYARCLEAGDAITAFEQLSPQPLILCVSVERGPAVRSEAPWKPSYLGLRNAWQDDLYILSTAMDWTFVITHEDDIGPFFALAETSS